MQLKFNATFHDGSAQNVHSFIRTLPVEALMSHEDSMVSLARCCWYEFERQASAVDRIRRKSFRFFKVGIANYSA